MNKNIEKLFGKYYHPLIWSFKRIKKYKFDYTRIYKRYIKINKVDKNKVLIYTPNYDYISPSAKFFFDSVIKSGYTVSVINKLYNFQDYENFLKTSSSSSIIVTSNDDPILNVLPIRKETKIINLWHGCGALKKFGCSKMKKWNKSLFSFKRYKNLDLFTVSSEKVIPFYSEATALPIKKGIIKATGISRTDVFFDKIFINSCLIKKKQMSDKKIILYAPTFRGTNLTNAYSPNFIDFEKMKNALSENYILLIKRHPDTLDKPYIIPDTCKDFVIDVSKDGSISELIVISDILISDYSSLFFEWCLFDKPVLFLTPDFEQYIDERGFYIDFKSIVDKARCNNTEDLIELIKNISKYDFSFVKQIRDDYMSACDGHSTERIVELMKSL